MSSSTCSAVVEGHRCWRPARSRGLCISHYRHWRENPGRELRLLHDQGVADHEKRCGKCREVKPLTEFNRHYKGRKGVKTWCRSCEAAHNDGYKFGVDPGWRQRTWEAQGGRCGICRCEIDCRSAHIDHDHETGRARGLLCLACNHEEGRIPPDEDEARAWLERFLAWRRG